MHRREKCLVFNAAISVCFSTGSMTQRPTISAFGSLFDGHADPWPDWQLAACKASLSVYIMLKWAEQIIEHN